VEAQQTVLFQPEIEAIFEQFIEYAKQQGNEQGVRNAQLHLGLLRVCRAQGIDAAFAALEASQNAASDDAESDEPALPFDADLIPATIRALLGSPQDKMTHAGAVAARLAAASDPDLKAFLNAIQMALFGGDLTALGANLSGVYRTAWDTIAQTVEAGSIDPKLLEAIASNTIAVFGAASGQRSQWRDQAGQLRNAATAQGARGLASLMDAVIGLLDANGDPSGLGDGLQGVYARVWAEIVAGLRRD
jgi:hypothetical protein